MTRKGSGAVIILLKKRTVAFVFGAVFLAAAASGFLFIRQEKQALSPKNVKEQRVIVLDAGHGGEDGGAVSAAGVPESNINLAISQKTHLLFIFTGQTAIMTREGEDAIYSPEAQTLREKKVSDLNNRVKLVNKTQGSFLITIEPARQTAVSVQQALNSAINHGNTKNAKQIDSSIFLMKNINSPGILVECGFMSNASEAKLLQTDDHQRRLCAAIVSGYLQERMER